MFLSKEDLYNLTGKKRASSQLKVLKANGIDYFVRADGKPSVLIASLENKNNCAHTKKPPEPNWSYLNAEQKNKK